MWAVLRALQQINSATRIEGGGSKATSKWQWVRITLHAGFTKILLSRPNKFRLYWQQRESRAERTNVKYDWQVSSGNTGWAQRSAGYEVTASKAQSQRVIDPTKKGGKWKQGMWTCGEKRQRQPQSTVTAGDRSKQKWGKEKGSRGRWDAKRNNPAQTVWNQRLLFWHYAAHLWQSPCFFVRQLSATESCKKTGRRRRDSDNSRSARCRHFIGSNRRASKKNNSRSSDVSGQGECASRKTFKWGSRHPSRKQMSSKKNIINMLKAATPKWGFKQINFVVDNRGSVAESDFYTKLEKLHVHALRREKK